LLTTLTREQGRSTSVERAFGRLKNEAGLTPLRLRGLDRVSLHGDLTILTTLSTALVPGTDGCRAPRRRLDRLSRQ